MKDFRLFDVHDFLMDEDFIRWVRLRGQEDNDFWNNWLVQNPDKYIMIMEAKGVLESFGNTTDTISDEDRDKEIRDLLTTIEGRYSSQSTPQVKQMNTVRKKWWYAAAAVFVALLGTAGYFLLTIKNSRGRYDYALVTPSKRLIENVNTSAKPVTIRLPDESTVQLLPNSRISYANDFDSAATRDIYLLGEALFTVTKNPSRPFRVFANEIVTKVLGTSFVVRSFDQDSIISIAVNTGKVSVHLQETIKENSNPGELDGIILTPNQELVYQKAKEKFRRVLRNNPAMVVPLVEDRILTYEDYPIEKVLRQLSENYGLNILFDGELLGSCTITADLRNVPFYEKLDLICKAIGARYEVIDGQVVLHSKGCN